MAWGRIVRGTMVTAVVLAVLTGCGSSPPPEAPPRPLRILVVGANGWTSPGLLTLCDALRRAGHTVVQVSPLADKSASGTALSPPPVEILAGPPYGDQRTWATSGTSSDSVLIALRGVLGSDPPDLMIAGIDPHANVGANLMNSGTVGAAMTGAALGVPSIALSVDLPDAAHPSPSAFDPAAEFAVQLVGALSNRPAGTPVLPPQTVLNVNYPGGRAVKVVGTTTAHVPGTVYSFREGSRPGAYVLVESPADAGKSTGDVKALGQGDVTLSDLSANPDRTAPPPRTAVRLAPTLHP